MNVSGLKNVVWREGGNYVAQSLHVDVASFGPTKQKALANLKEALELYFEDPSNNSLAAVEDPEIITM